jgi:preprotein translocase subunit SecB
MTQKNTDTSKTDKNPQPEFAIGHLYVTDASFEMAQPMHRLAEWKPDAKIQMDFNHKVHSDHEYEVILTVTADVHSDDQKVFIAEVQQAGAFLIKNFRKDQLEHLLESYCPSVLLPYARQALSDLIIKGGFPPLFLSPVDFETQYQEKKAALTDTT